MLLTIQPLSFIETLSINILYFVLYLLIFFIVLWGISKTKIYKNFIGTFIEQFVSQLISGKIRLLLEKVITDIPGVMERTLDKPIEDLFSKIFKKLENQTLSVQHLNLNAADVHFGDLITTGEPSSPVYDLDIPKKTLEKFPEIKSIEKLFKVENPDYDKIIYDCDEYLEKYEKQKDKYLFHRFKARALIIQKKFQKALSELEIARGLCSSDSEIYFYIAKSKMRLGAYESSENNFKKAIELNNNEEKYFVELGLLYWHLKKIDKAIEAAKKAHEIYNEKKVGKNDYGFLELHNELEFYYCLKADEDEQIEFLEKAEEINNWFEKEVDKTLFKGKLGYLEDTMAYFYYLKAVQAQDINEKKKYGEKAHKLQLAASNKINDLDVLNRLRKICNLLEGLEKIETKKEG